MSQFFVGAGLDAEKHLVASRFPHSREEIDVAHEISRSAHKEPLDVEMACFQIVQKINHLFTLRIEVVIQEVQSFDAIESVEQLHFAGDEVAATGSMNEKVAAATGIDQSPFVAKAASSLAAAAGHRFVVMLDLRKTHVLV